MNITSLVVGEIRNNAHREFIQADAHNDAKCLEHKRLDAAREAYYVRLKRNNTEIMAHVTEIQENNRKIANNKQQV